MAYQVKSPIPVSAGGTGVVSTTINAVLCSGTSSAGAIQPIASVGTAGQFLISTGSASLPTMQSINSNIRYINVQSFTGHGTYTYTPTPGMVYCTVELIGGGGGAGGCKVTAVATAGGGAGGYCRKTYSAASIGASQTVVIGQGGAGGTGTAPSNGSTGTASTFSGLTANPGAFSNSHGTGGSYVGGVGGTATGGDINIAGGSGYSNISYAPAPRSGSGAGGNSFYGAGGYSVLGIGQSGRNGVGYGSGGSGAISGGSAETGGGGQDGICLITEFMK